jgi:hypothetical protein
MTAQSDGFDKYTFVTRSGKRLRLKPVSPLLLSSLRAKLEKEWRERGEPLDPPHYTVRTVSGEEESFPHTEETEKTPEEAAAWAAHQAALQRFEAAWVRKLSEAVVRLGVEPDEEYSKGGWEKQLEALGIAVPEDEDERRAFYIAAIALADPDDQADVMAQVTFISQAPGLDREMVERALELFRRPLRERSREAFAGLAAAFGQVVAQ